MARSTRGSGPSAEAPRSFTPEEADGLIRRLKTRLEELRTLDLNTTRWNAPRVEALQTKIRDTAGEMSWTRSFEGTEWKHFKFARQQVALTGDPDDEESL